MFDSGRSWEKERVITDGSNNAARSAAQEVRPVLAEARRAAIAEAIRNAGSISVAEVEQRFGVSSMTARRDLAELERQGIARRTHGGAVLPAISAHEDSFAQRVETDVAAKSALAALAVDLLAPEETVFLDSSSTSWFVARRIVESGLPLTVLTNSLAVIELVSAHGGPQLELIGIGGTLRGLTRSFVGPTAVASISSHFADKLFLSVKGVMADGALTDADPLEAEVKRAMVAQSAEPVLLVDRSKMSSRGLAAVVTVADLTRVIAYDIHGADLAPLRAAGVTVQLAHEVPAS